MNKAQQKRIALGEEIYEDFVQRMSETFSTSDHVSNPRTSTLEIFALLEGKGMIDELFREMVEEYLSNFKDRELFVQKGRLFFKYETTEPV